MLTSSSPNQSMSRTLYARIGKRSFDFLCAIFGLIIILPILLLVAIAVKLSSRGSVFFRQQRTGQFGELFRIFKFRTMKIDNEGQGSNLTAAGDPRITPFGSWLRKTKLDELPQLLNVLLGDMSLVGPRPEVPEFTATYSEAQKKVLEVRPGITGPSANVYEEELLSRQANKEKFYAETVLPAKLKIDLSYCENISFTGDLNVLLFTFVKIFKRIYEMCRPPLDSQENQI
jgi:lipopolysaccharide/colanic/teichoic acid biosynthesis glycosyltransferase